jgi:hypothetical protein
MFHERVADPAKLKMSWTSVGEVADDGTSRYTEINLSKQTKDQFSIALLILHFEIVFCSFLTVLSGIGTTNGRSHSRCSTNLEGVRAGSGCWLGDRERNKVQPTTIICLLVLQSHLVF